VIEDYRSVKAVGDVSQYTAPLVVRFQIYQEWTAQPEAEGDIKRADKEDQASLYDHDPTSIYVQRR
jgi:hypothetical protein